MKKHFLKFFIAISILFILAGSAYASDISNISKTDNMTLESQDFNDYLENASDRPAYEKESLKSTGNEINGISNDNENSALLANETYTIKVFDLTNTTIVAKDFKQYACDFYSGERGGNFVLKLTDNQGNALANKTLNIGYNGITLNPVTDENGNVKVQINLKNAGDYTFVGIFLGDASYNACMKTCLLKIVKKPITITAKSKTFKAKAKTKKYTITLKTIKGSSANGKTYLSKGKKVTLTLKGKTYTGKSNAKGQVTFKITKLTKKGKYKATIKFAGDNTYKPAKTQTKITIK